MSQKSFTFINHAVWPPASIYSLSASIEAVTRSGKLWVTFWSPEVPIKKKGESLDDLSHWKLKLTLVCPTQSLSFSFFPFCLKDSLTAISVEKPSQELHFLAFKTQQHWYKLKDHLMEFTDCTFDTTHLCREASIWTWTASCSSRAFSLPDLCRSSPSTWIPPLHPHAPPTLPNF